VEREIGCFKGFCISIKGNGRKVDMKKEYPVAIIGHTESLFCRRWSRYYKWIDAGFH
jgi:hypothetical protein